MTTVPAGVGRRHRLKLLYIQPGTTTFAGIERVVDTICCGLSERYPDEFEVDVLYVSVHKNRPAGDRKYTVIDSVASGRIGLMRNLRRIIGSKDYDLVVVPQIEPAVICMASCIGMRRKFAVHLHGNPRFERSHLKAKLLFLLMKAFFLPRVSSVFGTSPRQLEDFKALFNSTRPQYWVPNPVRKFENGASHAGSEAGRVTFVNVGRFSFQKGQDILLAAFERLCRQRPNVRLKIVGHGEEEAALRAEIARLGLQGLVDLEHHPDSPQPVLLASDVYVSSSRWEGWSLAICEALRFGLPVVATDCEFGPSDILVDDRLGRLVPANSVEGLSEGMLYYCDHLAAERAHADFRRDFIDRYSEERVVEVHAQALRSAVNA
ncbi:glycosyltransferase [Rhizobium sp. LC145]|jgi:glycosyltransferase involved in cell wall biosynthesis|uniref:glycosyltransferase n=1 Tax=Rhizobium sp. LC145 TaxID=1120688 RepID=UPI000A9D25A2|nr:glycosyltransferase [Rhizobium sp. LC145]TKT46565.1 glycosyltransferase family 4 protein [Rhizobiaceae bacterium LC148]